jgi:hypothetical protein
MRTSAVTKILDTLDYGIVFASSATGTCSGNTATAAPMPLVPPVTRSASEVHAAHRISTEWIFPPSTAKRVLKLQRAVGERARNACGHDGQAVAMVSSPW